MACDMTHSTYRAAQGRWREIFLAVGVEAKALNRKPQPCPLCGGTDRFQFTDRSGEGDYVCRGCGSSKGMQFVMRFRGWDFKTAAQEVDKIIGNLPAFKAAPAKPKLVTSRQQLNELWRSGREIGTTDPAGIYLISRGLTASKVLRYVPRLAHFPTKTSHPGMIALFSDAGGKAQQLQRLYLTDQGRKAEVEPNRMFMPGGLPEGGAIRLGEPADVMGIAEGIETALAAAQRFGMVVWATTSEIMLQKWNPPAEAKHIVVFGDNDVTFVGQAAAYALAKRLVHDAQANKVKIEVEVRIPEAAGTDWADHGADQGQGVHHGQRA